MFQIKSDHDHPKQQNQFDNAEVINLEPVIKPHKVRKIRIKSLPNDDQNQYFLADALVPELEISIGILSQAVFQAISEKRKKIQLFVYTSLVEDDKDYLSRLFRENKTINFLQEMVSETVLNVQDSICNEIIEGEYQVHKIARAKKSDIFGGPKPTEIAIRIRQQMLKAKLTDFKADINNSSVEMQQSLLSNSLNPNSADLYSQGSYKTQKAREFVKQMQEMQNEQRREREMKEEQKRQKQLQVESQKKEMQQRMKKERHEYLKKQFETKRQQKQKQRKQIEEKNNEFKQYLSQFKAKVPLFKQKQKEFFQKFVIPENKKKLQLLKQIKEEHRPLSHDQLQQHERQYLQIKQDHVYQKNAAKAVQQRSKKPEKPLFKNKFHSQIEKQEKIKFDPAEQLEMRTKMYEKRIQYAQEVKTKFIPKVDPAKKQQLSKKIEQLNWLQKARKNTSFTVDSYKKDGRDNLQKLHIYIAQLKAKGKAKYSTSRTLQVSNKNSQRYKNYLQQLRQQQAGIKTARSHSIDYSSLLTQSEDAEKFKIDIKKKEQRASRREQYLAHLGSRNIDKYMQEKKKLDEDYLQSVKAKMAIINKFQ